LSFIVTESSHLYKAATGYDHLELSFLFRGSSGSLFSNYQYFLGAYLRADRQIK